MAEKKDMSVDENSYENLPIEHYYINRQVCIYTGEKRL
jgi:hypothetical protein